MRNEYILYGAAGAALLALLFIHNQWTNGQSTLEQSGATHYGPDVVTPGTDTTSATSGGGVYSYPEFDADLVYNGSNG